MDEKSICNVSCVGGHGGGDACEGEVEAGER